MSDRYRRPCYLVHGLMGTAYAHFPQIARWSARQVVPVDLPGHGRCPVEAGPSYHERAVGYLEAVMTQFGPGDLVAASYLGAPVALSVVRRQPHLVRSLVLTGVSFSVGRDYLVRALAGFTQLAGPGTELREVYERLHGPEWPGVIRWFSTDIEPVLALAGMSVEELGSLDVPVLVCNGSMREAERETAQAASRGPAGVEGHVVDGAGHLPAVDQPVEFAQIVEQFWASRAAGGNRVA